METILHLGLSNALAATVLAILVAGVAYFCRRPALVHSLWLLVLLRLLLPPLFSVPVPWPDPAIASVAVPELADLPKPPARFMQDRATGVLPLIPSDDSPSDQPESVFAPDGPAVPAPSPLSFWKEALFAVWLTGSVLWLSLACRRSHRFWKLLRYARPADPGKQEQVRRLAVRLGLHRFPSLWFVPAAVSPMLCALIGAPRLVVPAALWDALSEEQRETLLVHELAHLRRRDHWVRRLEFAATLFYWWHPVLWWARREIEEAEEQCCDAWVVSLSPAVIPAYAEALVATITFLSRARPALPLGASGMGHAHSLRRRLTMIMRGTTPKGLSAAGIVAVVLAGAVALPLLPTWAQTAVSQVQDPTTEGIPDTGNAKEQAAGAVAHAPDLGNALADRRSNVAAEELQAAQDQVDLLQAQLQSKLADTNEARARYQQAQRELQRKEELLPGNLISKEELDQARLEVEAQGARLQGKQAQVKEAEVRLRQAQRLLAKLRDQQASANHPDRRGTPGADKPAPRGENTGKGISLKMVPGTQLQRYVAGASELERKLIQFRGRHMPWKDTLEWLATQTGLPVIPSTMPDGFFDFYGPPNEKYTIPQVIDMLNGALKMQPKPMLLIRGPRDFQLITLDRSKPLDPSSLPRVTEKELDEHGDTELVILDLRLDTLAAGEIAKELSAVGVNRKFLGPLGQVWNIPGSNHLVLRDTVQNLKNIVALLRNADEVEKKGGILKHTCIYVKAREAERILKDLLGIASSNSATTAAQRRSVHVTADEATNTVFVSGPPDKLDLARKALVELDVAKPSQAPARTERYIRRSQDEIVLLIPLEHVDAITAHNNIMKLFDVAKAPAPKIDFESPGKRIVFRGTAAQLATVKEALKTLGEDTSRWNQPTGGPSSSAGLPAPADTDKRMKQLEEKLDKLLNEVEALRRQSQTREGRPH